MACTPFGCKGRGMDTWSPGEGPDYHCSSCTILRPSRCHLQEGVAPNVAFNACEACSRALGWPLAWRDGGAARKWLLRISRYLPGPADHVNLFRHRRSLRFLSVVVVRLYISLHRRLLCATSHQAVARPSICKGSELQRLTRSQRPRRLKTASRNCLRDGNGGL